MALFDLNVERLGRRARRPADRSSSSGCPLLACLVLTGIHVYLGPPRARPRRHLRGPGAGPGGRARHRRRVPRRPPDPERRRVLVRARLHRRRAPRCSRSPASTTRPSRRRPSSGSSTPSRRQLAVLVVDRAPQGSEHIKQLLVGQHPHRDAGRGRPARRALRGDRRCCHVGDPPAAPSRSRSIPPAPPRAGGRCAGGTSASTSRFGVVVTSSVRIAGVLLVFSYLVVPAAVAALLAGTVGAAARRRLGCVGAGVSAARARGLLRVGPADGRRGRHGLRRPARARRARAGRADGLRAGAPARLARAPGRGGRRRAARRPGGTAPPACSLAWTTTGWTGWRRRRPRSSGPSSRPSSGGRATRAGRPSRGRAWSSSACGAIHQDVQWGTRSMPEEQQERLRQFLAVAERDRGGRPPGAATRSAARRASASASGSASRSSRWARAARSRCGAPADAHPPAAHDRPGAMRQRRPGRHRFPVGPLAGRLTCPPRSDRIGADARVRPRCDPPARLPRPRTVREEAKDGRSPTDPPRLSRHRCRRRRRRALRLHAGAGAGLQLEALPGQGALPAPDQAPLHRRAREEHPRVRVALGDEGQVGDAARRSRRARR